jgi:hypothetical protein
MGRDMVIVEPEVLLPAEDIDLTKWAVIACDQFTQDAAYWEDVERFVASAPSTLRLIFPEIFLEKMGNEERAERIARIHSVMRSYLEDGVFAPPRTGFISVERRTPYAETPRLGIIACVDLERYDWKNPKQALVRATEGTVADRLPPRMDVRRGAGLETPHILLLLNDPAHSLLPAINARAVGGESRRGEVRRMPLYKTPLMFDSGGVSGWAFSGGADDVLADWLERGAAEASSPDEVPFLFAVGDGNHSLAAAKAVWDEYKAAHADDAGVCAHHPARYALVEIVNLHDPALRFEPIHRVLFGTKADEGAALPQGLLEALSKLPDFAVKDLGSEQELRAFAAAPSDKNRLGMRAGDAIYAVEFSGGALAVAHIQPVLDEFARAAGCAMDYVHGADAAFAAARQRHGAAVILPPVRKDGLFETVSRLGVLPRKSFSMGEAVEKRFYMECRRLFG